MKPVALILMLFWPGTSTPVPAGQKAYDDCILHHLKDAKLDLAAHLIRQACEENHLKSVFTSEKRRAYNNCLLENLAGVESVQATMDIRAACGRKYD